MPRKLKNPKDELNILQKLLTSKFADALFGGTGAESGNEQINRIRQGLMQLQNKPKDFVENPAQALGQSAQGTLGLLLDAATQTTGKKLQPAIEFSKGMVGSSKGNEAQEPTNPLDKAALQEVQKLRKEQVQEAYQNGIPLENIASQVMDKTPQQDLSTALAGQQLPQQNQINQEQQYNIQPNILQKLFDILPGGTIRQINREAGLQQLRGDVPLQKGRFKELEIMHKNRMSELMTKQGINEDAATAEIFKNDLSSLIENYNKVNLKGTFGNVAGAPLGFLGVDREDRKVFESSADSLVYSVASYIAGQEGRGLSDRDINLVNKWAKFSLSDRSSDFKGKLKNLIQKANARLRVSGGTPIPGVEEILKTKQKLTEKNSPKVLSFEIEGE